MFESRSAGRPWLSAYPPGIPAELDIPRLGTLVDLFEDKEHELNAGELTLDLGPYAAHWFRVRRPGQRLPP